jgi:ATP-dependent Clp protease ATP-binding subunit ClpC
MELDVNFLLAGAQGPGEIINRLAGVLNDAVAAGNVILFIDNIEALFGGGEGSKVGAIDAAQVIIPYLEHPGLFIIATTSTSNYHQYIETKKAISEKFEKIEVREPEKFNVIRILEDIVPEIERQTGIIITYEALKSIVELSDRYLYDKPFPEKAIGLLNDAAVFAASKGKKTVMITEHIEELISTKTNVPIGEAMGNEKEKLLNLEKILHQRVIGQDEAVKVISNAMRRARAGMASSNKPIGTFMFLGPTGVGKTETCKALAEAYFGSEDSMIRFDMSEFQDIAGIYQLIGAPQGTPEAQAGGKLTNAVRDNPFSLILFDELEKAHPDILNLFLQVFDEGWLTDSLGRKVKFNNSIIIATSNAGAQLIQESIKQGMSSKELKDNLMAYLQKEGIFKPEFLNRFTAVVNFNPLTQEQVVIITDKLIKALSRGLEQEKGIMLEIDQEAVIKLAELGYDPLMGARPIQRVIQKKVEDILARRMLSGEIGRGSVLKIGAEDIAEND